MEIYIHNQMIDGINVLAMPEMAHCSCAREEDEDDEAVHLCGVCKS